MEHKERQNILSVLRCPVCAASVQEDASVGAGQLYCLGPRKHTFDFSKSGHVHLAPRHIGGGDAREAVRARTAFLSAGYYSVAADALCALIRQHAPSGMTVDAGCGEGYYTNRIASECGRAVCGFDLSRDAVEAASKAAKRQSLDALYAVASLFELPLGDATAACVVNVFAPCAEQEFCRVLADDGVLIVVGAGERHLLGLKQVLYDQTYENGARADLPTGMRLVEKRTVSDTITVKGKEQIAHLFSMTPYYWRTSPDGRERLGTLAELTTEIEFDFYIYQKK